MLTRTAFPGSNNGIASASRVSRKSMPASRPLSRSSMAVAVQTCRARRKAPGSKAKFNARITNETSISITEKPSSPEAKRPRLV